MLAGVNHGSLVNTHTSGSVVLVYDIGTNVGGLVGWNVNVITNSYATGNVSEGSTVATPVGAGAAIGGLIGQSHGSTSASYSIGFVQTSSPNVITGGLVGRNADDLDFTYWNTQTSGQSNSVGGGMVVGTGLTTAQLQSGALPTGFDPSIWTAAPGRNPKLKAVGGQ